MSEDNPLLDIFFKYMPEIPFMRGEAGRRGFVMCLNEDGSVNPEKAKEYYAAKAEYDAEWANIKAYCTAFRELVTEDA